MKLREKRFQRVLASCHTTAILQCVFLQYVTDLLHMSNHLKGSSGTIMHKILEKRGVKETRKGSWGQALQYTISKEQRQYK
jgi:hypothetical protein